MHSFWAIIVGVLFTCSTYLMLRRSIIKNIIGVIIMAHAANLVILISGGLTKGTPAIIEGGENYFSENTEPLTQALVLTAIVIGFGVLSFLIILIKKFYDENEIVDSDLMEEN